MKSYRFVSILLFLGCIASCKKEKQETLSPKQNKHYPVVLVDSLGKFIQIPKKPLRIVVAGTPLYSEILLALGASKRVVGITASKEHPKAFARTPSVGKSWPLNIEKVLSLRPDLVLGTAGKFRDQLLQIPSLSVFLGGGKEGSIHSLRELFHLISQLDIAIHGNKNKSKMLIQSMRKRLRVVSKRKIHTPWKIGVAYLGREKDSLFYVEGKNSLAHQMIEWIGTKNVFQTVKQQTISLEWFLQSNPEIIVTAPSQIQWFLQHPKLQSLQAIQNKRVFGIKASHLVSTQFPETVFRFHAYLESLK